MNKSVLRSLCLGILLMLLPAVTAAAQPASPVTVVERQVPVSRYTLTLPQLTGLSDRSVELSLNDLVRDAVREYILRSSYDFDPAGIDVWTSQEMQPYYRGDLVSFGVRVYSYIQGGAHPNNELRAFTVDTKTGKVYKLADLFASPNYQQVLDSKIKTQLAATEIQHHFFEGVQPEDIDFYLTDTSLVMFFQQGKIAAYAMGLRQCVIPYDEIADIMSPELLKKLGR